MPRYSFRQFATALLAAGVTVTAKADGDKLARRPAPPPKYVQECGSCHIAFPAALLPAASWRRLMEGLPHHFGSDASLEPSLQRELGNWLAANAATGKFSRESPAQDRITRANWFSHEHGEIPAAIWKLAAVKSPANCAACHEKAADGDFDEDHIHIPR